MLRITCGCRKPCAQGKWKTRRSAGDKRKRRGWLRRLLWKLCDSNKRCRKFKPPRKQPPNLLLRGGRQLLSKPPRKRQLVSFSLHSLQHALNRSARCRRPPLRLLKLLRSSGCSKQGKPLSEHTEPTWNTLLTWKLRKLLAVPPSPERRFSGCFSPAGKGMRGFCKGLLHETRASLRRSPAAMAAPPFMRLSKPPGLCLTMGEEQGVMPTPTPLVPISRRSAPLRRSMSTLQPYCRTGST
mmetsp:Transcript_33866/g.95908  ORF Transcript_33866/g.95908 Transcript_33866/m.95908 type:complete len:240 (+) Transcript_33866:2347-3066(+)